MKYALAKFRVYLLGNTLFAVYTDHASLRTAVKPLHISQRMASWLFFFTEYNFRVEYKSGRLNIVADALSRRPDCAAKTVDVNRISVARIYTLSSSLLDEVNAAYAHDADAKQLIEFLSAPSEHVGSWPLVFERYRVHDGLLFYSAVDANADHVVVPNFLNCAAGSCTSIMMLPRLLLQPPLQVGAQERTYLRYLLASETCTSLAGSTATTTDSVGALGGRFDGLRVWPSARFQAEGIVVFVDRISKMVHLVAVVAEVTSIQTARLFVVMVFKHNDMPSDFVPDRYPRFTARLWQEVFPLLETQFSMSTGYHPQTDRQTERVNRMLVDLLE
ncbi:reverse transcriptase [Phytophthora megakarya]|uniref:Reverse transcriptase n=1 Tax=Phytophthora megakarya TaxID=4795 RepID=A0A225WLT0_9STRA|nr:reverse transcriptase [Phytophthora megakarya]